MEEKKHRKITLQAISDALGISKTTVSLVLKGDGDRYRISAKTQQRIRDYAESHNFEPNFIARALATQTTKTVGLVFPDIQESFMSEMLRGIESVLYAEGYSILLSTSGFDCDIEKRNIRQLLSRKVDGIVIAPYIPIAQKNYIHEYLPELQCSGCPTVFVDRIPPESKNLNWITQDDYESAFEAAKLLCRKGCRKVGCISFDLDASTIRNRLRGITDGLNSCGGKIPKIDTLLLKKQQMDADDLLTGLKRMLSRQEPVDGLIITTGGIAHKVHHLREQGQLQLGDIPIIKFGKDPDYFSTGMIQIIQPNVEMGRQAAETVLQLIKKDTEKPVQLEIKSKFVYQGKTE